MYECNSVLSVIENVNANNNDYIMTYNTMLSIAISKQVECSTPGDYFNFTNITNNITYTP